MSRNSAADVILPWKIRISSSLDHDVTAVGRGIVDA
jgi:hypothetical protein